MRYVFSAVLLFSLSACASIAPTREAGTAPETNGGATRVADVTSPMVVSHRGGAAVYPEETMIGFRASSEAGYYPEMDIQFLRDGTPVLVHDETADRTMRGVSGPIADLTREQWERARVVSPTGGEDAPAVFLEEVLDELGGEIVLVPEIKPGATTEQIDLVLDMIATRGLGESVIVQSFDYEASKRIAEAGLASLFLVGEDAGDHTPESLLADGIEWFGPSREMPAEELERFTRGGVKVAPYTLDTRSDGEALDAEVFGFFTDDPWT